MLAFSTLVFCASPAKAGLWGAFPTDCIVAPPDGLAQCRWTCPARTHRRVAATRRSRLGFVVAVLAFSQVQLLRDGGAGRGQNSVDGQIGPNDGGLRPWIGPAS